MAITNRTVSPGDDLYSLAAEYYQDATAWTLIARANGLTDPLIQSDMVLSIPAYNANQVNGGILAST
jgi:nucleoid-associated protein YgaU